LNGPEGTSFLGDGPCVREGYRHAEFFFDPLLSRDNQIHQGQRIELAGPIVQGRLERLFNLQPSRELLIGLINGVEDEF
jgi:hypothetical protein